MEPAGLTQKSDVPHASNEDAEKPELTSITLTTLSSQKLGLTMGAFMIVFSLVALDQTILSTALPKIASHFNAVSELSWIASAYFLPQAAFMLFFGRILSIAPAKIVFLVCVAIFELGSLFCAIAPSVNFLIFGRAVAGLGASGIWVSIMTVIARVTTVAQRPIFLGIFGAVYAVASVVGPLIGGAFADRVSWRWCFYINLPLGPISMLIVFLILPCQRVLSGEISQIQAWRGLDWIGALFSFAIVVFLLVPLQWGGNSKTWNDPVVIVFFVLFALFMGAFLIWEERQGWNALLPLRMLRRRNMLGAFLEAAFLQNGFVIAVYFLPLLYQIRGHSATHSGIDILPYMLSGVIATLIAGAVASGTQAVWPFLFCAPLLAAVGFGLLFTIELGTKTSALVGYQILVGVGLGSAIQNTIVIAQAEYADNEEMVPLATSLITFIQCVGGALGLAIGGAIFAGQLRAQIRVHVPDLPPDTLGAILSSVETIFSLPAQFRVPIQEAYTLAVDRVLVAGVPFAALGSISALLVQKGRVNHQQRQ